MGHKNKKSLIKQVQDELLSKLSAGESRHIGKQEGIAASRIYSYGTLDAYMQQCCMFVKFAKSEYGARTLDECRPYVNDFLQRSIDSGKSSYTIKLQSSALAKLYDCSGSDSFIATPARCREQITRSRGSAVRDDHFSEARNRSLVDFCCSVGTRRHELVALTGDCLRQDEHGNYHIWIKQGKGGRSRLAPVVGTKSEIQNVVDLCNQAGTGKVFAKVHNGADIHHYRAIYADRVYKSQARPVATLQSSERYHCRGSKKGIVYDRQALMTTSRALGHNNRASTVASHYLYTER